MSSSFAKAWQEGAAAATALMPRPDDRARRVEVTRRAASRPVLPALLAALARQQARLPASEARARSLETLSRGGAAVVVTGQQVGLFGGPLYAVHKALSAVAAARLLEAESGVPVVPVFWLQTEDHDFAEIDHCRCAPGPQGGAPRGLVRLGIADGGIDPRVSVAHRTLGADVTAAVVGLGEALAGAPFVDEAVAAVAEAYVPGRSLAEAFARYLARLVEPGAGAPGRGLLFFDPRPRQADEATPLLAPVWRRALDDAEGIAAALVERTDALAGAGFGAQVHVRTGSPLVFFHDEEAGPRYRLDPTRPGARDYLRVGAPASAPVSLAELRRVAEAAPRRFSSSALLRPVLQDVLFPTAAYVGGPGEIAYLVQSQPLYARFDLPAPLVLHRARFRVTDGGTRRTLAALGLEPADCERPHDELWALLGARAGEASAPALPAAADLRRAILDGALGPLDAIEAAAVAAARSDPGLARAFARTRASLDRAASRFSRRYGRALADRDGALRARLERVVALLHPEGAPQERVLGPAALAARVGTARLLAALWAAVPADPAAWGALVEVAA